MASAAFHMDATDTPTAHVSNATEPHRWITVDLGRDHAVFLPFNDSSMARTLAAELIRAADELDALRTPVTAVPSSPALVGAGAEMVD